MKRIAWIDAARGIGIVLVVFGHVEGGLVDAGIQSQASWAWPGYLLYTFHMPLFLMLAGLNVPHSLAKGSKYFLHAKLQTIAYPYVLWSLIQGGILVAASSYTNSKTSADDLLSIGWQPLGQFWFLYALMVCQLVAMAIGNRRDLLVAVAAASFVGGALLPRGGIVEEVLHSFPFFAAGIYLADAIRAPSSAARSLLCLIGAVAGLVITGTISGPLDGMNPDSPLALPAAVCGMVLVITLAQLLTGPALTVASLLGRWSMTIYILHVLAAAGTRIVMTKLHVPGDARLYMIACTVAGVAAPMAAHVIFTRMNLLAALGLAASRPRQQFQSLPA